jgi:CRP-like cAMP-binding protein
MPLPTGLVLMLAGLPLLAPLPTAALAGLAEHSVMRMFAAHDVLVHQDHVSQSFFLLVSGRVRVARSRHGCPDPLVLAELGEGEVVGEMGALDGERRSATVTALEDTVAVELPATALADILLRFPEVGARLLREVSRRLRSADERMEEVAMGEPLAAIRP